MSKLLLVGPSSIHLRRYYQMVKPGLEDIMVVTDADLGSDFTAGCKIVILPLSLRQPWAFYQSIRTLRKLIQTYQPDIIHCHMANTATLAVHLANRNCKTPTVLTAWGSDILVAPRQSHLLRKMVEYNLAKAQILTSDSQYMADIMQELVLEKHLDVRIVNFGIGVTPDPSITKENLVYSNRLHEPLYRIEAILRGFKRFTEDVQDSWTLVVAGAGSQTKSLQELAKAIDLEMSVEFVGWLSPSENEKYYNRAKIYVSIPESDATSISLLEGMACGCIPVVSNLPANREWVEEGKNGVIVKDVTLSFLKSALVLDSAKVQQYNQDLIERKGSVRANQAIFLQIYQELLRTRAYPPQFTTQT